MREPISIGYLLARASDTIADTEQVPAELREKCLAKFCDALNDKVIRLELIALISKSFSHYQTNRKEQLLLEKLEEVYNWYDTIREWAWSAIAVVMKKICDGQMKDIRYFAIDKKTCFTEADELESYCYQVAGCVGEFWSEVGYQSTHQFSSLDRTKLGKLGRDYGIGLQLVNILRDLAEDFKNGRCYLPVADSKNKQQILEAAREWRITARSHIESGIVYAKSLSQWRARVATILPALIARETLNLLDEADWRSLEYGIKVDRKTVRRCFRRALFYPTK